MAKPYTDIVACLRYVAGLLNRDERSDAELLAGFAESRDELAFTAPVSRYAPLALEQARNLPRFVVIV